LSKIRQEHMLTFYFNRSIQLEDLLTKKYDLPKKMLRDNLIEQTIKDFRKNNREHIRDLADKMNRLGIQ
jgi:hypothetical protein